ncbi:MAG: PA14 domain-containing protein [Polyangiaceae bacterium]
MPTAPLVTEPFLFGNGDNGAFRGFAYAVPQGTRQLPNLSSMSPFAQMFVDSLQISPRDFTGGFPGITRQSEWFAIRYDGKFLIRRQGAYTFRLVADDGAILYIDGDKVVDNDGVHASESRTGVRTLTPGAHTLRVDYLHTVGPVSLMVFSAVNGEEAILVGAR